MKRYRLFTEQDGQIRPWTGRSNPNLPWEDTAYLIVDTQEENRIVARFDEGTAFPNNPLTQAWNALAELDKGRTSS